MMPICVMKIHMNYCILLQIYIREVQRTNVNTALTTTFNQILKYFDIK